MTAPYGGYNSEPTMPGPFSFLQGLGQVYAAHKEYQAGVKQQAQETAARILQMRQLGYVKPEDFSHPDVIKIFNQAGIPLPSSTPTTQESIAAQQGAIVNAPNEPASSLQFQLPSMTGLTTPGPISIPTGGQPSEAKAQLLGIPGPAATATLKLKGAQSTAELPNVAPNAVAGAQVTQDPVMSSVANRVVNDQFVKLGRLPTVAEAVVAGQNDIRARPYGSQLNEPFYGAAIQRLSDEQAKLQIAKTMAGTKVTGAANDETKKQQDALNAQIYADQKSIDEFDKDPLKNIFKMIPPAQWSPIDRQNAHDRSALVAHQAGLQQQLATLNSVGSGRVGKANPGANADVIAARNKWDLLSNQARLALDNPSLSPRLRVLVTNGRAAGKSDREIGDEITTLKLGARP